VDRLEQLREVGDAPGPTWRVHVGGGSYEADAVVLAVPGFDAAKLLAVASPELSGLCRSVPYSGVVTVTLAWPDTAIPGTLVASLARPGMSLPSTSALPGSGVLVPRTSGRLVTAATFTSTKWPRSAAPGEIVIRASAGRDGDERALALDDGHLVDEVRRELRDILGIADVPLDAVVKRWPVAFPQYVSGHLGRTARAHQLAVALPGCALAGATFDGIGIPACIASGERAAQAIAGQLDV